MLPGVTISHLTLGEVGHVIREGGDPDINTGGVVHRLHAALVDALDVDLLIVRGEACQTVCIVGEIGYLVIAGITTKWL